MNAVIDCVQSQSQAALCAAVNHVLGLEPELRALLAHHAHATLELRWPAKGLLPAGTACLQITQAHVFTPCMLNAPADVVVTVLEGFLTAPQDQKLRFLRVEGDAMLAQTLALLAQRLRWDIEHDLARWVGDAPAGFLAHHARGFVSDAKRLADALLAAKQHWVSKGSAGSAAMGAKVSA